MSCLEDIPVTRSPLVAPVSWLEVSHLVNCGGGFAGVVFGTSRVVGRPMASVGVGEAR